MKLVRHNIVFLKGNAASSTREEKKQQQKTKQKWKLKSASCVHCAALARFSCSRA